MNQTNNQDVVRILLAEDNLTNQLVVEKLLHANGWQVDVVNNGRQALEKLPAQHYDLILMDWHMLVLDGLEATRLIRSADADYATTPIVGLTGNIDIDDLERCLAAGMNDVVTKPVTRQQLLSVIDGFLVV